MVLETDSILFEVILSIAVSVGGGTILGYYLSVLAQNRQEKKDIAKTKSLLANDFERLRRLVEHDIKLSLNGFDLLEHNDVFLEELMSQKKILSNFIVDNRGHYEFVYWEVIRQNALLIKLNPDEIRAVTGVYNNITSNHKHLEEAQWRDFDRILTITKKEDLKFELVVLLSAYLRYYKSIYLSLLLLKMYWIDIGKIDEKTIEELNSKLKHVEDLVDDL